MQNKPGRQPWVSCRWRCPKLPLIPGCRAELVYRPCEDTFTIGVQNAYARDWLENRLSSTVTRLLTGMMDRPQSVHFVVWQKD